MKAITVPLIAISVLSLVDHLNHSRESQNNRNPDSEKSAPTAPVIVTHTLLNVETEEASVHPAETRSTFRGD
jgi:hypothetical protein